MFVGMPILAVVQIVSVRLKKISVPKFHIKKANTKMLKQACFVLLGAADAVYNELGYGIAEDDYQSAMEVELGLLNISLTAQAGRASNNFGKKGELGWNRFVIDKLHAPKIHEEI